MKKRCYSICVILWVLITTLSATSPTTFHIALKKIYPHATNVSWSQQGNYYVASFTQNGFEKEVWMNGNAQWVMTNTDLQTTDQLTPNVYNDHLAILYRWLVHTYQRFQIIRQAGQLHSIQEPLLPWQEALATSLI